MPMFQKKPVIIEAVQWNNQAITYPWFMDAVENGVIVKRGDSLVIKTLEGNMIALIGDWIIKGVLGELYPCKPEIFALTYEPLLDKQ